MTRRPRPPLALLVPAAVAALVALLPFVHLIDRTFDQGLSRVWDEVWQRRTFELLLRSTALTVTVTVACVLIGVGAAWLVTCTDLPGRRAWRVVLLLPLAVPSYLSAFAWVSWRPDLAGFTGAALVLTCTSYPYVMLPTMAALTRLDPAHEEVARSLGRGTWRVLATVTLPQLRTSISAGALLVALYVLSDFGAVAAMRYEVFTWVIYGAYRAGFDPTRAAILSSMLVAVAMVLVIAESRTRGAAAARVGSGTARRAAPISLGRLRWLAASACAAVVAAALAFPLWRIGVWAVSYDGADAARRPLFAPLATTLALGAAGAAVTVLLAIPVGVLAARFRGPLARGIERATFVTHALPGIVVAISLVFVGTRLLRPIYLEPPLLVLGYVVLFLPLAVAAVRTSVEQSSVRAEEVARSLGDPAWRVAWRVTTPAALPGIAAGAAMVMLATMKELPVTLILRPTGTDTMATMLWRFTSVSDYGDAAPYALGLVVFAAIPTAILTAQQARDHDRRTTT